jgi:hypothetical protein
MRRLACVVVLSTILLAGCGSHRPTFSWRTGPTGGTTGSSPAAKPSRTSGSGANTHAAVPPMQPAQLLQSSTQLQSDLEALKVVQTEGELINAVNVLRQQYQAVAGSHAPNPNDTDWQQALSKLQLTLADVQQLANTNSSDPDAPNPLNSGAPASGATPGPNPPVPAAPNPVSNIVSNEIRQTLDLLATVINHVAYAITVNNPAAPPGGPFGLVHGGPSYPDINCGPTQPMCKGYVLALTTVSLAFDAPEGGKVFQIGPIDSAPNGACNPAYVPNGKAPAPTASCHVSGSAGMTVTITPHWVSTPAPTNR